MWRVRAGVFDVYVDASPAKNPSCSPACLVFICISPEGPLIGGLVFETPGLMCSRIKYPPTLRGSCLSLSVYIYIYVYFEKGTCWKRVAHIYIYIYIQWPPPRCHKALPSFQSKRVAKGTLGLQNFLSASGGHTAPHKNGSLWASCWLPTIQKGELAVRHLHCQRVPAKLSCPKDPEIKDNQLWGCHDTKSHFLRLAQNSNQTVWLPIKWSKP